MSKICPDVYCWQEKCITGWYRFSKIISRLKLHKTVINVRMNITTLPNQFGTFPLIAVLQQPF